MRFIILALAALFAANLSADYIVKYKDGTSETSKVNPSSTFSSYAISDDIEYIEENRRLFAFYGEYNDTYYSKQWSFNNYLSNSFYHAREYAVADKLTKVTVAVIDTGITNHFDLNESVIAGFDMISDPQNARDGGGRDTNPQDEGDFGDNSGTCSSGSSSSTWHGTHISGIIAAKSNNHYGIVGAASNVNILPIRVLGACGGLTSDIADAVRWAAGGQVRGAALNPNPAKVINMSLGARGSCSQYMQEAINFAKSRGAVVVVATGNSNADASLFTPSNCRGVLRVGAVNEALGRSTYSNYGSIVDIAAPGNNILSTTNSGQTLPTQESFVQMSGTSMAAGFISATVAMVYQANPELYPDQVRDIITRTSSSFYCDKAVCAKGIVDPYEAVSLAYDTPPNANFRYRDAVVVGGTAALNDRYSTGSSSGGACGTIDDNNGSNSGSGGMIGMLLILVGMATHRLGSTKLR